eukprot:6389310-Prymnesium_polylepis.2
MVPSSDMMRVASFNRLLECLLCSEDGALASPGPKDPKEAEEAARTRRRSRELFDEIVEGEEEASDQEEAEWHPSAQQLASLRALVQLALAWSVGGSLDAGSRPKFDSVLRETEMGCRGVTAADGEKLTPQQQALEMSAALPLSAD